MQSEGLRPMMCSRTRAGFTLNIIDTPGLIEGGYINEQAVEIIKKYVRVEWQPCLFATEQLIVGTVTCNKIVRLRVATRVAFST
jgi:hypothetical protein